MSSRLDPEEALAGPFYVVAGLLVVIPLVDFVLSVPSAEFSNVQWRFAAVGLLSGYTVMPILGLAMAFVIAAVLKQYGAQRWLVAASLSVGAILMALSAGFLLDMLQLRISVPRDGRAAFQSAWVRAIIKLVLSTIALLYMGWRARRMIPARSRHRPPKTVHVVSK
ncbi:MAG TPA: hypothetical protein VF128_01465 [Gemmatimonadaceae bacterium]